MTVLSQAEVVRSHIALLVSFPDLGANQQESPRGGSGEPAGPPVLQASPWVHSRSRRVFDCTVAALALLGALPLLALCWILVRCPSRGPALFRQRRLGRNGEEFELFKFRSMRMQRQSGEPSHTVHDDRRITPVGAMLRRYKLDELPQFWNVLKGDMSLVGPRPKLSIHESLHMPYRPGVTGHATLAFRHEERMLLEVPRDQVDLFYETVVKPIKAELDIRYMEKATFRSDVSVLVRTMFRCIECSGDVRQELQNLLRRHAPDQFDRLAPAPRAAATQTSLRTKTFAPELTDEFAGDLDDAA